MNWKDKTIFIGDNLHVMRGMNSDSVDLIYLDPPFNSNRNYAAPIGSQAAGAAFKDTWTLSDIDIAEQAPSLHTVIQAAREAHGKGMQSYLIMMSIRLLEMARILKDTGSIYLHCDPTASHYLKLVMDAVFGKKNFRNEVVWHYSGWNARLSKSFSSRHDVILFYGNSNNQKFNSYAVDWESEEEYIRVRKQKVHTDDAGRKYVLSDGGGGTRVRRYLEEAMAYGKPVDDVWDISKINNSSKEHLGYPTQKPIALLERIIKASSNPGDVVFDPFCGCATTLVVADRLQRSWVGIDISSKAAELVVTRISDDQGLFQDIIARDDCPSRTDMSDIPPARTHKHSLYGLQEGVWGGCEIHFPFRNLTIDHKIPRSRGGTDHFENLWLLCGACNSLKGTRTVAELKAKLN